jgi:hypothetical protein
MQQCVGVFVFTTALNWSYKRVSLSFSFHSVKRSVFKTPFNSVVLTHGQEGTKAVSITK